MTSGIEHLGESEWKQPRRIETVDLLRGLLMILMAIDHVRDFFSGAAVDPTDALHSWPALFATRWVTHLCAPGFVALAGTSVYLQKIRGKSNNEISRLLLTRGLWLIFLEVTFFSFAWSLMFPAVFFQVIWAIGVAMVLLALLHRLPVWAVTAVGAGLVGLHELVDPVKAGSLGIWGNAWRLLMQPGPVIWQGHPFGFVAYPALPWVGVICLGYGFGAVVAMSPRQRQRISAGLGVALLTLFCGMRVASGYGDAVRWHPLANGTQSTMSFLDLQKYPPSLEYCLATLGVLLLLFACFDVAAERDWAGWLRRFVRTYGEVPFVYYLLHLWLIRLATLTVAAATGSVDWHIWLQPRIIPLYGPPPGWGFGLPVVYALWAAVVLLLYLPCRWFSEYKSRHRHWWLSYF